MKSTTSLLYSRACKIALRVLKGPLRIQIREALSSLILLTREQMSSPRHAHLEYFARRHRLQFSGLMLLNSYLDEGNAKLPQPIRLQPLSEEQHKWIGTGDRFLRAVNAELLRPINDRLGVWRTGCDPYSGLRPLTYHQDTPSHEDLFNECIEAVRSTAEILSKHPGIALIEQLGSQVAPMDEDSIVALIRHIKETVENQPGRPTSAEIAALRGESSGVDARIAATTRVAGQVYLVRNAIALIDAILYDALLLDSILTLDENNVFDFEGEIDDRLGPISILLIQPRKGETATDSGDVAFVSIPEPHRLEGPSLVIGFDANFHHELGVTMRLKVRMMDEWMNPYPRLTQPG